MENKKTTLYIVEYDWNGDTGFDWCWAKTEREAVDYIKEINEEPDLEIYNVYEVREAVHKDDINSLTN